MRFGDSEQIAIPATWMRGGTSKALFFLAKDLPPAGPLRDRLIKRAMGCPQVMQIDGVGGGKGNTSKVAIIEVSGRDDADVEYTFAQVGIGEDTIDYRATCGNISAAVGPFALSKGLLRAVEPVTRVRIYNSNIDDLLIQEVPVRDGRPRVAGEFVNAGVPGSGAEVFTDFSRAVGKRTGKMVPTGHERDRLALAGGRLIDATLLDVGNPVAYVAAAELGLTGNELPAELNANDDIMDAVHGIREQAAQLMGLGGKFSVRVGLVSKSSTYTGIHSQRVQAEAMDLCARFFALDYCAPNYPGSAAVSSGAAARIPGSVVYRLLDEAAHRRELLRIGHPQGVMEVLAVARHSAVCDAVVMERLGFGRTARAIMEGVVLVPREDLVKRR